MAKHFHLGLAFVLITPSALGGSAYWSTGLALYNPQPNTTTVVEQEITSDARIQATVEQSITSDARIAGEHVQRLRTIVSRARVGLPGDPDTFAFRNINTTVDSNGFANQVIVLGAHADSEGQELKGIANDAADQAARGKVITQRVIDRSLVTQEGVDLVATIQLQRRAVKNRITFETDKDGLGLGQLVHLKSVGGRLDGDYVVQSITTKQVSDERTTYTVTAGDFLPSERELLRELERIKKGPSKVTEVPPPDNSVGPTKIKDLAVETAHIQDLAVDNAKIKDLSADKITVPGTLWVGGDTTLAGSVYVGGDLDLAGNMQVGEDLIVQGTLTIGEGLTIEGTLTVGENLVVEGEISADVIKGGEIDADISISSGGSLTVAGSTNLNGTTTFGGNIVANGSTNTFSQITVSGNFNAQAGVQVNGNAAISNTGQFVGAGGVSTFGNIDTAGVFINNGTTVISGGAFVGSSINTSGTVTCSALVVGGESISPGSSPGGVGTSFSTASFGDVDGALSDIASALNALIGALEGTGIIG